MCIDHSTVRPHAPPTLSNSPPETPGTPSTTTRVLSSRAFEVIWATLVLIIIPLTLFSLALSSTAGNVLYWALTAAFVLTSVWVCSEVVATWYARTHSIKTSIATPPPALPPILCIVPAYMDNEQRILKGTLEAYATLPGPLTVLLVYNVKNKEKTWEFEEYLRAEWADITKGADITFRILENATGRSKAANVNAALEWVALEAWEYVGVFDADHHPQPHAMHRAMHCFADTACDVVQGQCAIRNFDESFLTRLVAMEFTEMYNIGHEGRAQLFGLGLFGGSNGLWRAEVLGDIKMDGSMLTEDIDSAFRALLAGKKISYCRDMVSFELAPVSLTTLLRQRQRWAQGWFEVSLKYFWACVTSKNMTALQKVGCVLILAWREAFVLMVFYPVCLVIAFVALGTATVGVMQWVIMGSVLFLGLVRTASVYTVANPRLKQQCFMWFVVYVMVYPVYSSFMNLVHATAHWRHFVRKNEWIATSRDSAT